jgi:hypothetical protein
MRVVVHTALDSDNQMQSIEVRGYKKFQCTQRYLILFEINKTAMITNRQANYFVLYYRGESFQRPKPRETRTF